MDKTYADMMVEAFKRLQAERRDRPGLMGLLIAPPKPSRTHTERATHEQIVREVLETRKNDG